MFESERRDLAWVPRWGIARVNRRQSVAEHSYFVALYGLRIARATRWDGNYLTLTEYLLRHDEVEAFEGDIPSPVKVFYDDGEARKRADGVFGKLVYSEGMRVIKRAADLMDECMYLAGEVNSGNRSVLGYFEASQKALRDHVLAMQAGDLLAEMEKAIAREAKYEKSP